MAEYQIPDGPFVVENDTVEAQVPGWQFIVMDAGTEISVPKSTKFFLLGIG